MPSINVPGVGVVNFPDTMSQQDIVAAIERDILPNVQQKAPPKTGFLANIGAGIESAKGDIGSIGAAFGVSGAEEYSRKQQQLASEKATIPEFSDIASVKDAYNYASGLAGRSLPYMVAPIAAAVSAPAGVAAAAAGTAAGAIQFFGTDLTRQLQEGKTAETLDIGSAAAAAPFQAALDTVGFRYIPGLRKIFGQAGVKMSDDALRDVMKTRMTENLAGKVVNYGTKAVQTAGVEGFTEAGQQVLERAQAGLNITDPEARKEYFDSFIGGAVLGGGLSIPGQAIERSGQETQYKELQRKDTAAAQAQAIADKEAADAAAQAAADASMGFKPTPVLPDTYAEATQEVERLKKEAQTDEIKARIAELEAYKYRLTFEDIEGMRRKPYEEPKSLEDQIKNQTALQGEFRETVGLPTREVATATEAPVVEKEAPTVLDATTLDATGLPKQSGIYKQLLGKDLTDLEGLDAVMQTVERAKANKNLSHATKQALDSIATNAFNIYGKQAEMFGPRGKVLEPIKPEKVTPVQQKIDEVTKDKDLTDPAQVEAIRAALTDYANAPTRSAEAIAEVSTFLDSLPSAAPKATEVIEPPAVERPGERAPMTLPTQPIAPEPSIERPGERAPMRLPTQPVAPPAEPAGVPALVEPAPKGRVSANQAIAQLMANGFKRSDATQYVRNIEDTYDKTVALEDLSKVIEGEMREVPEAGAVAKGRAQGKERAKATALEDSSRTIEGQVRVIDEETIAPAVLQLSSPEQQKLAEHYGEPVNSPAFLERLRKDISDFATKGAQAVDKAIRNIIRKLNAAVLAAAVILNPNYMSAPVPVVIPKTVTTIEQVKAVVPAEVAKNMSSSAQMAFANIFPAIQAELKAKNKFFVLTDKPNARVFIFDANGKPILDKKVLVGKTMGDFYKGKTDIVSNRITPAGLFTLGLRNAARGGGEAVTAGHYDFGKVFVLDKAIDGEYSITLFHSVWTHEKDSKQRLAALQKEGAEDSRYSFGCINVDKESYGMLVSKYENQMDGAKMFVVPDNPDTTMDFINGKAVTAGDLTRQAVQPVTKEVTKTVPGEPSTTPERAQQVAARKEEGLTEPERRVKGVYREGEELAPGEGMRKDDVQTVVDSISKNWENAPNINVVQDIQELPQSIYQQMVKDNALDAPGVYDPDTKIVHLISDNIKNSKEATLTLAHEALGHFGLRSILGHTYDKMMDDIYAGNAKVRELADKKIKGKLDKRTAVEEVLAEMAEKDVSNSAVQRVMNAIRQWLRKMGVSFADVSDNEVRALLANANRFVHGGKFRAGEEAFGGKPLYRTRPENLTPEGEEAAALNERMKNTGNPKKVEPDSILKKTIGIVTPREGDVSLGTRFRREVVDARATAVEKMTAKFNNTLVDAVGDIRGDLAQIQAQDHASFAEGTMEHGGIQIGKDNLVEIVDRKATMGKVFDIMTQLGNRLGSLQTAMKLGHNAFIAQRAEELNVYNAKIDKDIAAAEAKGNKKAVEKLVDMKVTHHVTDEEIAAGKEAMQKFPELKEAFNTFTEYKNGLIDFLVQTGRISEAKANDWKEAAGYVPWTRVEEETNLFEENPASFKGGVISIAKIPILDRNGSRKEIANVFDNMIGLTSWAVKSGMNAYASRRMAESLPDAFELKTDDAIAYAQKFNKDRLIFSYKDGERTAYMLGSALDKSAFASNIVALGPILKAFSFAQGTLRSFITHMPAFAVSQLIQDGTYRAMLLSGVKQPFSLPAKVAKNFMHAMAGEGIPLELARIGVAGVYDGMPQHAIDRARVKYGLEERGKFSKAWDKLEKFSLAADLAVRAAIYDQTINETKSPEMPEGDRKLAMYRAKEYINFKHGGNSTVIGTLRHMVPFLNAYIQGMDILVRTMQGKGISMAEKREAQKLFLATGLKIPAMSALYAMLVGDDDEYKGMEGYERDKNYIIPGTGVKIPVAPEVGFMFKVIPERIVQYVVSQGTDRPQDATAFYKGFKDAFIASYSGTNLTPQLIKPALEVGVNYSFFTGNPIVGAGMKNLDPSLQFTTGTSELAKLFGMVGISPMKADYLIRGYTGMMGAFVLDATDAVANPDRMGKPVSKLPQLSTFMYDTTGRGYKSEFYDFRESVDQVVDTVNMFKREGRMDELKDYMTEDKMKLYAMRGIMHKAETQLSNLRKFRNIIANDSQMPADLKREKTDAILEQEKELLMAYNVPKLRAMAGM